MIAQNFSIISSLQVIVLLSFIWVFKYLFYSCSYKLIILKSSIFLRYIIKSFLNFNLDEAHLKLLWMGSVASVEACFKPKILRKKVITWFTSHCCRICIDPANVFRSFLIDFLFSQSFMESGVERIVEQTVDPKIYSVIEPLVESVVYKVMGVEKTEDGEPGKRHFIMIVKIYFPKKYSLQNLIFKLKLYIFNLLIIIALKPVNVVAQTAQNFIRHNSFTIINGITNFYCTSNTNKMGTIFFYKIFSNLFLF